MDISEGFKLEEKPSQSKFNSLEVAEEYAKNNSKSESAGFLLDIGVSNSKNVVQLSQSISEDLVKQNKNDNFVKLETSHSEITSDVLKNDNVLLKNLKNVVSDCLNSDNDFKCKQYEMDSRTSEKQSEAIVKVVKPLCADYSSGSDSESVNSESDSSTLSTSSTLDTSSETEDDSDSIHDSITDKKVAKLQKKKLKSDLTLLNLPPIEDLKISVPENACVDIGTITNIVDILVVVESYKGTAALDLDTVLFLDHGKRTLGKVFDILGPITEPIYTVRFNSQEQINHCNIKKGLKVYFAPKTEYTNFVFMTEVLKNRGTDASWKDNAEAPPEFQDFSDDEEEKLHKNQQIKDFNGISSGLREQNNSRKRSFNSGKQTSGVLKPSRFRNSNCLNFQRDSSSNSRPNAPSFTQTGSFFHNPSTFPPQKHFPPRFSGPPFPSFGFHPFGNENQNFHRPFYQPRVHTFHQTFGLWGRPVFRHLPPPGSLLLPPPPPPPPPLPAEEVHRMKNFWTIVFGIILISTICVGQVNFTPNWGKRSPLIQRVEHECKSPLETVMYIYKILLSEAQKITDCEQLNNM